LNQNKIYYYPFKSFLCKKRRKRTVKFNGEKESLISSVETEIFADRREETKRAVENVSEGA